MNILLQSLKVSIVKKQVREGLRLHHVFFLESMSGPFSKKNICDPASQNQTWIFR